MKFLFALSTLLAAASTITTVHAEDVCFVEKDLVYNGEVIGHWHVSNINMNDMDVEVDITGFGKEDENDLNFPYIDRIIVQVCCTEEDGVTPDPDTCSPLLTYTGTDTTTQLMTLQNIEEPTCLGPIDMKLRIFLKEPSGIEAYNQIFGENTGVDVVFTLHTDAGSDSEASYFDATFGPNAPAALAGKTFDGYCVDREHFISTGTSYAATAYSFFGTTWDTNAVVGNIDKPENMPAVAYCLNHWFPGTTYLGSEYGTSSDYLLTSGTLQRAIWGIVDDTNLGSNCPGCGANDYTWAGIIRDDCLANGLNPNFVPGCDDEIPIILVPDNVNRQNQYVQTTFSSLEIPCNGEVELVVDSETHCTTGGSGESSGDPHFKTFGGQWFDFHGGCDLVLAHFPDFGAGLGLAIDIRTTTRYDYSYIETAAIKIGDDILEVSSFGQYMLNSISQAAAPFMLGGYPVEYTQPRKYQHLFAIDLGSEKSIVVKVYKDLVYVNVDVHDGDNAEVKNGMGLLGTWMGGTRLARDGVTVLDNDNEYGQEWQVRDTDAQLFTTARAPQWPAKCEMPNPVERASRRLGENVVSAEEAATACGHIKEPHHHDMCVYDVIATADLSVAQGGAY